MKPGEDPASMMLGIEVTTAESGRATASMIARPEFVNGAGVIHGAIVFALADTALAAAVQSTGEVGLTSAAHTIFTAPAVEGQTLHATAAVISRTGRTLIVDATVRRDDVVVAEVRGTFKIVNPQ